VKFICGKWRRTPALPYHSIINNIVKEYERRPVELIVRKLPVKFSVGVSLTVNVLLHYYIKPLIEKKEATI
jgi:hypothetical protein